MAVDYSGWVATPNPERVLLCQIKGYNPVMEGVETLLFSTQSANDYQNYLPLITKTPIIQRRMAHPTDSSFVGAKGFMEIDLGGGSLDHLIYRSLGGRQITFLHGDIKWDLADFVQVHTGNITGVDTTDDNTLRVDFADDAGLMNTPINTRVMSATDADGRYAPLCYGKCFNVTPVLMNASTRRYKVHDTFIKSIDAVYADGVQIYNWSYSIDGNFNITSAANDGQAITCDARGDAPSEGGTQIDKIAEIALDILTNYGEHLDDYTVPSVPVMVKGHLPIAKIDTASFTAFDVDSPSVGLYSDGNYKLLDALQDLVGSDLGFFDFSREGKLRLNRFYPLDEFADTIDQTWTGIKNTGNPPNSGEFSFDLIPASSDQTTEHTLLVHSVDFSSTDRNTLLNDIDADDAIKIYDDSNRWVDYRVITAESQTVGAYHMFTFTVRVHSRSSSPLVDGANATLTFTTKTKTTASAAASFFINDDNVIGNLTLSYDTRLPTYETIIGYAKNWSPAEVRIGTYTAFESYEYRNVKHSDANAAAIKLEYLDAKAGDVINTLVSLVGVTGTHATGQAEIRQEVSNKQHYFIMPTTNTVGLTVNLGDVGEISSDRLLLSNQRFTVTFIEDDMLNSTSTVGGWF